ncbi:MAG: hypothetical protein AABW90_01705 [Nanoarchaeota archaeon]
MDYRFIFPLLTIGFILPSFILPWVVINLTSQYSYSPLNIILVLINEKNIFNEPNISFNLLDLMIIYVYSYFALVSSMITYLASFITMILSLCFKKHTSKILLVAGILAILSSILWIYSIESFKTHFTQNAEGSGGIIGEEFRGKENIIISTIIKTGIGHKITIAAGVFAILAYLWPLKKENESPRTKAK